MSADPVAAEQQHQRVDRLKSFLRRRKEQLAEAAARHEAEAEQQRQMEAAEDPEARYHQHPNNRSDPNHPAHRPRSPGRSDRPSDDDLVSHFSFASGFHQLHGSRTRRGPSAVAAGSTRGAGSEDGGGAVPGEGRETPRFKRASVCMGNGGGEKGTGAGDWTGSGEGSPGLGTRSGVSTWAGEAEGAGNGTVTFLTTVPSMGLLEEDEGLEGKGRSRGGGGGEGEDGPGGLEVGASLAAIQRMEDVLNRHHQRCGTPRARAEVNPVSLAGSVVAAAMGAAAGGGGGGGRMASARKPVVVSVHSSTAAKLLRSGSRGALGSRGSQRGQAAAAAEGKGGGSSSRRAGPGAGASGRSGLADVLGCVVEEEAPQEGQESQEEDLWDVQLTDPGAGAGQQHAQRKQVQAGGAAVPRLALQSPATGLRTLSCGPFSATLAMSARLTAAEAAGTITGSAGTGGASPQRALHGSLSARAGRSASSRAATPRAAQGSTLSTGLHPAAQQPLQQQHKDLLEHRRQPPSPARVPSKLAANPRGEALAAAADIRRGAWGTPRTHSHGRVIIHQDSQETSAWDAPSTPPHMHGRPAPADSSLTHCGARSAPHLHPSSLQQQSVAHHQLPGGGHLLPSSPGSHSLHPTSHTHMGCGLNTHPAQQHYHDTLSLHMLHHHHHHDHHLPGYGVDQQQRPWTTYDSPEHARYVPLPLFTTSGADHAVTASSNHGTGPHMELGLGLGGAGASLRVSTQTDSCTPRQQLAAQQQQQQRGACRPPPSPRHSSSSNTTTGTSRQHLDHGVEVMPMAWVAAPPPHASSPQLRSSHHPHLHSLGPGRPATASAPGTQPTAGSTNGSAHGGSGSAQGSVSGAAGSVGRLSLGSGDRLVGCGGRSSSTPLMRASWDASGAGPWAGTGAGAGGVVPSGAGGGMGSLRGRLMRTSLASSLRGTPPVTPRGGNAGHSGSGAATGGAGGAGAGGGWAGDRVADGSVLASVRGLAESPRGQPGAASEEDGDGAVRHGGVATDGAGEGAAVLSPQRSARVKRKPELLFGGSVVPRAAAAAVRAVSAVHTPPTSPNPYPAHTAGSSPRGQAPRHHLGLHGQMELPPMGHPYPAPQLLQLQGGHLRSRGEPASAGVGGGGARGASGAGREGAGGGRGGAGSSTGHLGPWEGDGLPSPTGPRAHSSLSQGHAGGGEGAAAGAGAGGGGERVLSASTSFRAVQSRVEQLRQEGQY